MLFLQPDDDYHVSYPEDSKEALELFYLGFGGEVAETFLRQVCLHGPVLKLPPNTPVFKRLLDFLPSSGWNRVRMSPTASAEAIFELMAALSHSTHQKENATSKHVNRAMDHMLSDLQNASLNGTAYHLGISRMQLHREFSRDLGDSPGRWLRQQKLDAARLLLTERKLSLEDIALQCGFSGATPFIDAFQKMYGMTPGTWRRST